mmetsp:Transcript_8862/g.29540  ORF Transcript_8862/g.29540 Transcript_8862/m.29540 type:complete len:208 (-) Transcript_8862:168-791(-)
MPILTGRILVTMGADIPVPSLPKPPPFLYPIFSRSFMPMPLVCFSNSPMGATGLPLSPASFEPSPPRRDLVFLFSTSLSATRARSTAAAAAFAVSASSLRCAALCITRCPNVEGSNSSSSLSESADRGETVAGAKPPPTKPKPPPLPAPAAAPRPKPALAPRPAVAPRPKPAVAPRPSPPRVFTSSSATASSFPVTCPPERKLTGLR